MTAPGGGVVELIGNPRAGSRTRALADALVDALLAGTGPAGAELAGAELAGTGPIERGSVGSGPADGGSARDTRRVLELGEIVGISFGGAPPVATGTPAADPPAADQDAAAVADPFAVVRAAKLLVVATPTYKGTYTGLLKVFLDRFGHQELAGVVAIPVAIAASEAHRRSVGADLSRLLAELGARVPAAPLAVLEPQAADPVAAAAGWVGRHRAAIVEALAAGC